MSASRYNLGWRFGRGAAIFFFCLATRLCADMIQNYVEPQMLDVHLAAADLGVDVDQRKETDKILPTSAGMSGSTANYTQTDVIPTTTLALNGSIYHPNLISFTLKGQVGYDAEKIKSNIYTNQAASSTVQNYDAQMRILGEKPYAVSLSAGESTFVQEYDFFNTVHGETTRYGGSAGYTAGQVPFTVVANHLDTTAESVSAPLDTSLDTVAFNAHNRRDNTNFTELVYTYNKYTTENIGQSGAEVTDNNIQLHDREDWGHDKPAVLDSRLYFDQNNISSGIFAPNSTSNLVTTAAQSMDYINLQEHFDLQLTPALHNFYDLSMDYTGSSGYNSYDYQGAVGLEHQLFRSLTSRVNIHGSGAHADDNSVQSGSTTYGAGLSENYSKQLGAWGQLNLGFQGTLDHQDNQQPGSSTELPVFQERHSLSDNTITFLNLSQVDNTTIQVTDQTGLIIYREGLDYVVIPQGVRTEIQRVVGGLIPNGATVLVTYSAATPPSASGEILNDSYYARLDFFQGLLELYGRINQVKNYGGLQQEELYTPDSLDEVAGAAAKWWNFSASAEYEIYESTLTPYHSTRLTQSYSQQLGMWGRCGLSAGETWTSYSATEQYMKTYQFIANYGIQLTSGLSCSIAGGRFSERGNQDLDMTTMRGEVNWRIGELSVRLSYELEGQTVPGEQQDRQRIMLNVRRLF